MKKTYLAQFFLCGTLSLLAFVLGNGNKISVFAEEEISAKNSSETLQNENSSAEHLWGAYRLYYSGFGLRSSYDDFMVVAQDEEIPYLKGISTGAKEKYWADDLARSWKFPVDAGGGTFWSIDALLLRESVEETPVIQFDYRTENNAEELRLQVLFLSENNKSSVLKSYETSLTSSIAAVQPGKNNKNDWRTASFDLRTLAMEKPSEPLSGIILALVAPNAKEFDLRYFAFFANQEKAAAFSPLAASDKLKECPPRTVSFQEITSEKIDAYFEKIGRRFDEIMNKTVDIDPSSIRGTCFYVSSIRGNDNNDGLSPETPWASLTKVNQRSKDRLISEGDAVFFERGSRFVSAHETRGSGYFGLFVYPGVTYAAYGTGKKPVFTNSRDFSSPDAWRETEYKNVYAANIGVTGRKFDVGNIVFNHGQAWGVKIQTGDGIMSPDRKTSDCAMVTNGLESYDASPFTMENPGSLTRDLMFFYDFKTGDIYLNSAEGNPGERFDSIIACLKGHCVVNTLEDNIVCKDILLDNLAVEYTGGHGFQVSGENLTIQNCSFRWIGGSEQEEDQSFRYGNAVESWGTCNGLTVQNCFFTQCYDTAITTQGSGVMENVSFINNVIGFTNSPIEVWTCDSDHGGKLAHITTSGNYAYYSGYGFGGTTRGYGGRNGCFAHGHKGSLPVYEDVVYSHNVSLYASYFNLMEGGIATDLNSNGAVLRDNIYVMSLERGNFLRANYNLFEHNGYFKNPYPYQERFAQWFANHGVETGSVFYYYRGELFPNERLGVFYNLHPTPEMKEGDHYKFAPHPGSRL